MSTCTSIVLDIQYTIYIIKNTCWALPRAQFSAILNCFLCAWECESARVLMLCFLVFRLLFFFWSKFWKQYQIPNKEWLPSWNLYRCGGVSHILFLICSLVLNCFVFFFIFQQIVLGKCVRDNDHSTYDFWTNLSYYIHRYTRCSLVFETLFGVCLHEYEVRAIRQKEQDMCCCIWGIDFSKPFFFPSRFLIILDKKVLFNWSEIVWSLTKSCWYTSKSRLFFTHLSTILHHIKLANILRQS